MTTFTRRFFMGGVSLVVLSAMTPGQELLLFSGSGPNGSGPPQQGFAYLLGADGAYLQGADGAYLLGVYP